MSGFDNAPNVSADFSKEKGEAFPRDLANVSTTASAELDNAHHQAQALDAHARAWENEIRKLARVSDPYPDFDLGARAHRNLVRDYDERRAVSDARAMQIGERYQDRKNAIRETGQTLGKEFKAQAPAPPERASPYVAHHARQASRGRSR